MRRQLFCSIRVLAIPVLLGLSVLAGCGGDDGGGTTRVTSSPVATEVPTATKSPINEEPVNTLVLPTRTPVGGDRASALPGGVRSVGAASGEETVEPTLEPVTPPKVYAEDHTPGPTQYRPSEEQISFSQALSRVPCIEDFRLMLLNYDGPEEFGPEVAERLSEEFVERREDCAAQGWNPGFPRVPAGANYFDYSLNFRYPCYTENTIFDGTKYPWSDEMRLEYGFYYPRPEVRVRVGRLTPTKRLHSEESEVTRVLIHFDPLPFKPDSWGCWFGRIKFDSREWWWNEMVPDSSKSKHEFKGYRLESGYTPHRLPQCDALLQSVLTDLHDSGTELDLIGVAAALETVKLVEPDDPCGGYEYTYPGDIVVGRPALIVDLWKLFPQGPSRAGCHVTADTGRLPDGGLVVNWHPDWPDSFGGSPCWVLSPEGEWSLPEGYPDHSR